MRTPLGQYAAPVAAAVAILAIGAYVFALLFEPSLSAAVLDKLEFLALVAIGAVFGSAVAVNGYKAPIDALGAKLDATTKAIGAIGAAVVTAHPESEPAVRAAVAGSSDPVVLP